MPTAASNPYRMERIHALGYHMADADWDALMERVLNDPQGALVGAHGSGKTTLLLSIGGRLEAMGHPTLQLFTNADTPRSDRRPWGRSLPRDWREALGDIDPATYVLADGYSHLGRVARASVRKRCPRLIVTAHEDVEVPTHWRCRADPAVLAWVTRKLKPEAPLDEASATNLLAKHTGNMRDALRYLYDNPK